MYVSRYFGRHTPGNFLGIFTWTSIFVLLETAAIKGFRAAFSFDLGVIVADIVFLFIAYLSTSKLLSSLKMTRHFLSLEE